MTKNNLQSIIEDLINKGIIPKDYKVTKEFIDGNIELFRYIYALQTKYNKYRYILNNLYEWLEENSKIQYQKTVWNSAVYSKVLRKINELKEVEVE